MKKSELWIQGKPSPAESKVERVAILDVANEPNCNNRYVAESHSYDCLTYTIRGVVQRCNFNVTVLRAW